MWHVLPTETEVAPLMSTDGTLYQTRHMLWRDGTTTSPLCL